MSSFRIKILLFYFIFGINSNAYAYLDPGTGAYILQILAAAFAAVAAYFGFFINKIKIFFRKIKNLSIKKKEN